MAQQATQKPTVVFNKGLITERGELTFPEGASVDELNMSLERDGSRRRRLGLEYESGFQLGPTHTQGSITSTHIWENAGGVAGLTFIVVQNANILHFYQETEGSLSGNKKSFTVNLSTYNRPVGFGASSAKVETTVLEGILVVASSEINTIKITYDDDTDSISTEELQFRIRDFEFQGDTDDYQEPLELSEEIIDDPLTTVLAISQNPKRAYDSKNSGWVGEKGSAAYGEYIDAESALPPLSLPWYSGKDADGNFDVAEYNKVFSGTSLIANGSYILDLYEQDREAVSGVAGLNYTETSRFKTVATFAGRVFYSGMSNKYSNKVFFSRILFQTERLGDCYQINDPTSEDFSDLLDTDGGVIDVQGAYNIRRLQVLGPYLIVFAENGVWTINGVDNVFRATEYAVNKITEVGLAYDGSFVSAQGRPYWWSDSGIHTLVSGESGELVEQNLSLSTIQTFWGEIDADKRAQVVGVYDEFNQRVAWLYPDDGETTDYKKNNILFFDEPLAAFYPWKVTDASSSQYILDPIYVKGKLTSQVQFDVIDSNGDSVVDSNGDQVVVTRDTREYSSSQLTFLVRDTTGQLTFAEFTNTEFLDWGSADYTSFAESGYNFLGDLALRKNLIYATIHMSVTEEGVTGNDVDGYNYIRPSSCLVSSYWDFKTTVSDNKQQAYRLKKLGVPESAGAFDYPFTVTTSRLRIRGRGRSMRMRFESEQGKDFHLLGFDVIAGRNRR